MRMSLLVVLLLAHTVAAVTWVEETGKGFACTGDHITDSEDNKSLESCENDCVKMSDCSVVEMWEGSCWFYTDLDACQAVEADTDDNVAFVVDDANTWNPEMKPRERDITRIHKEKRDDYNGIHKAKRSRGRTHRRASSTEWEEKKGVGYACTGNEIKEGEHRTMKGCKDECAGLPRCHVIERFVNTCWYYTSLKTCKPKKGDNDDLVIFPKALAPNWSVKVWATRSVEEYKQMKKLQSWRRNAKYSVAKRSKVDGLTKEQRAAIKKEFNESDLDKDGSITAAELVICMKKLGHEPTPKQAAAMIAEVDGDGDGTVSFDEFLKMATAELGGEEIEGGCKTAFINFDKNSDGFLTAKEMRAFMEKMGEPLTKAEADEMVRQADGVTGNEKDGKVDFSEFQLMMKSMI